MLKILHRRILQKPLFKFGVIAFQLLVFLRFFGFDVIQRLLLAIARYSEPPQQPGPFQTIALLNVIQILAHAQNAFCIVIRLVSINHGQIQAQHGVRAGNAHLPFSHLNHVVTVTRNRLVNERNRVVVLAVAHRNLVMFRHNLADSGVLGDHHVLKVVVF